MDCRICIILVLLVLSIVMASGNNPRQIFREPTEGQKLIRGTNTFALDLYKNLAQKESGNVFLSPASISIALGMTHLGAKNNTLAQMTNSLRFKEVSPSHLHQSLCDLMGALKGTDDYKLHTANRLYGHHNYKFLDSFLEATKTHYSAELQAVDFNKEAETRQMINSWVEGQTANKIKDLIPSGVLNDLTRLVLVNAIYFKGDWLDKFDKRSTKDEDFFISSSNKIKVPMMHMNEKKFMSGYSDELKAKAIELPYKGEKLSMVILLPDAIDGLNELENALTIDHLMDLHRTFRMHKVKNILSLPRFKVEASFSLKETLTQLGMNEPFTEGVADFSGMDGTKDLYISAVVHKAFVNVDEEGSEAAAATGVIMMTRSLPRIMEFKADHPFLFMIRENETGSVLFMGRMSSPPPSEGAKEEL